MSDWTQHHRHATPSADCHLCPKAQAMSTKEPTLAELIVNMRERGLDYCLANHDTDCMCGPAMQLTSDKISAFHVRVNALAEKWEREALPLPDDPRRISESAGFNYAKRLCAAELRKLTGDLPSRDKQQGEPEICRESVTIPMVQEVYGSQPQIRAGIGPTEPVRPMSEPTPIKLVNRSLDYKSEPQWEDMWSNYLPRKSVAPIDRPRDRPIGGRQAQEGSKMSRGGEMYETFFCESCEKRKPIADEVMLEDCSLCRECFTELKKPDDNCGTDNISY